MGPEYLDELRIMGETATFHGQHCVTLDFSSREGRTGVKNLSSTRRILSFNLLSLGLVVFCLRGKIWRHFHNMPEDREALVEKRRTKHTEHRAERATQFNEKYKLNEF